MHLHYLHLSNLLIAMPASAMLTKQAAVDEIGKRVQLQSLLELVRAWDEQGIVLDFILISGDVAQSGQAEEYRIAEAFIDQLTAAAQLPPQRVFVVPGNHDIDRDQVKALHIKRLYAFADQGELQELLGDAQSLHLITQKFTAFNQFASQVMARPLPESVGHACSGWGVPLALDKQGWRFTINLLGLNTALFGGYEGDNRQRLAVSQHQLEWVQRDLDADALFNLACIHHPAHTWHVADQTTWAQLQNSTQVILTGAATESDVERPPLAHVFSANNVLCRLTFLDLTSGQGETQAYRYQADSQDWRLGEQAADVWSIPAIQLRYADYQKHRPALYVIRIKLTAFQCFTELSLEMMDDCDNIRWWVLCLGENSAGKSAILRSLGIGLVRNTDALRPHMHTPLLERGAHKGQICLDLKSPGALMAYRICTDITLSGGRERFQRAYYRVPEDAPAQPIREDDFPWSQLFVCGYGTGRSLEEDAAKQVIFDEYSIAEAVTPLFNYQRPMQHPELSLRRIIASTTLPSDDSATPSDVLQQFQALIADLFMFAPTETIELTAHGLEVVRADRRTALTAEGDGYRNTAAWVLDLLTWKMLQNHSLELKRLTGIVLIDEIEQHLHPRWQRHILRLLQQQFPKLQFIVTSHSPLCAGSLVDLPQNTQALLFKFSTQTDAPLPIPVEALQGLKADQILTSEAFDLATTRNPHMADKLARYAALFLQHPDLSGPEQAEYVRLQREIEMQLPEPAEQAATRLQQKALKDRLDQLRAQAASGTQAEPPTGKTP